MIWVQNYFNKKRIHLMNQKHTRFSLKILHFKPCNSEEVAFIVVYFTSNQSLIFRNFKWFNCFAPVLDIIIIPSHFYKLFFARVKVDLHDKGLIVARDHLHFCDLLFGVEGVTLFKVFGSSLAWLTINPCKSKCIVSTPFNFRDGQILIENLCQVWNRSTAFHTFNRMSSNYLITLGESTEHQMLSSHLKNLGCWSPDSFEFIKSKYDALSFQQNFKVDNCHHQMITCLVQSMDFNQFPRIEKEKKLSSSHCF